MTPKGGFIPVIAGVLVSTGVSFAVASVFVKRSKAGADDTSLDEAKNKVAQMKGKKVSAISKIMVACDAGMGSSAMGATNLRRKVDAAGLKIKVANCSVDDIPSDTDIVICHENLMQRAKNRVPNAEHIGIKDFLNNPVYDELVERLKSS
jgi:PTS system mannitol-specific IIC component